MYGSNSRVTTTKEKNQWVWIQNKRNYANRNTGGKVKMSKQKITTASKNGETIFKRLKYMWSESQTELGTEWQKKIRFYKKICLHIQNIQSIQSRERN